MRAQGENPLAAADLTELWDYLFKTTQLVEGLSRQKLRSAGMQMIQTKLLEATFNVGVHLVRANASDDASGTDRSLRNAQVSAIEADYWLRMWHVLQEQSGLHKDLSSVIARFSKIIARLQSLRSQLDPGMRHDTLPHQHVVAPRHVRGLR